MVEIGKIYNTVRFMTPRQWKYRLYYTVRNKLHKRSVHKMKSKVTPKLLPLNYSSYIPKESAIKIADEICKDRFYTISGVVKEFDDNIDWDLKDEDYRLICFKLNSFKWLIDLSDAYKCTGNDSYIQKGFQLIDDWHQFSGAKIAGDKWNPYVIAERLVNWIGFYSEYYDFVNKETSKYITWIYEQSIELKASLEYQLGANHLLSEGKALVTAGAFLNNSDLYDTGKKLLLSEFKEQFLADGGHYERSISYHVESLQQYFEAFVVMKACNDSQAVDLLKLMKEPYKFLNGMVNAAGHIPLFNDAAYDYPFFDAADFLATGEILYNISPPYAEKGEYFARWNFVDVSKEPISWDVKTLYDSTGYLHYKFNLGKQAYSFFFDVADCGPDSNLGHAHADALSILLSNSNKEIFVDSGVFTYKPGTERNECRSTKAHNTIEIDGENSAQVWSAFRVAKRGHSKVLEFKAYDDELLIKASHDGYKKCLKDPVIHMRQVHVFPHTGTIEIKDWLQGKQPHQAVSRFHIGPECEVEVLDRYTCKIDNEVIFNCSLPINLKECHIAALFGDIKTSKCIEIPFVTTEINEIMTTVIIRNLEES